MSAWIFRILAFLGVSMFGWFITNSTKGLLFGVSIGLLAVALELAFERLLFVHNCQGGKAKLLDISAILDGRVLDICETHFLSGHILVPAFFVRELEEMAKAKEPIKKAKGRRGLDVLAKIKASQDIHFSIMDKDIKDATDNHVKLVELAAMLKATVVTTDFSINKLGALKNVCVLNVNDLAIALKPVILPGEEIQIFVMKEGKDKKQGVGYLDDGTMIVIEDGYSSIGKKIDAIVQSILQTTQGRIIFTRIKNRNDE